MPFVGRPDENRLLREENWRDKSVLTVIYGRRRVGKTALIEHAFQNDIMWKVEGIENGNQKARATPQPLCTPSATPNDARRAGRPRRWPAPRCGNH